MVWQWPNGTTSTKPGNKTPEQANSITLGASQESRSQSSQGLASSADHVRATVLRHGDLLRVHLSIDDGWHVNANPASLDFLIGTQLTVHNQGAALPLTIEYPLGHSVSVGLQQPIRVYSDKTEITAQLPANAPAPLEAAVRIQACSNEGRCLMPSTLQVPVLEGSGA